MATVLTYSQSKVVTMLLFLSPRVLLLMQVTIFTLLVNVNSQRLTDSIGTSLWTTKFDSPKQQDTSAPLSGLDIVSYWSIRTNGAQIVSDDGSRLHLERSALMSTYQSASKDVKFLKTAHVFSEDTIIESSLGVTFSNLKNGIQTSTPDTPTYSLYLYSREHFASSALMLSQIKEINSSKIEATITATASFISPPDQQHFLAPTHSEVMQTSDMTQQLKILSSAKSELVLNSFSPQSFSDKILLSSQTQFFTEKANNLVAVSAYDKTNETYFRKHSNLNLSVRDIQSMNTFLSTKDYSSPNKQFTSTNLQNVWLSDRISDVSSPHLDSNTSSLLLSSQMFHLSLSYIVIQEYLKMLSSISNLETVTQNYLSAVSIPIQTAEVSLMTMTVLENTAVISHTLDSFMVSSILPNIESSTLLTYIISNNEESLIAGSSTFLADHISIRHTYVIDGSSTLLTDLTTTKNTYLIEGSSTFLADLARSTKQIEFIDGSSTFLADLTTMKQTEFIDDSSKFLADLPTTSDTYFIKVDGNDDTSFTAYYPDVSKEFSFLTFRELPTSLQNDISDKTGMPVSTITEYSSVVSWTPDVQTVTFAPSTVLTTTIPQFVATFRNDTKNWVLTNFRIPPALDILSAQFKSRLEKGLANCYYLARNRDEQIKNGTYVPLRRRRRRFSSAEADSHTAVDIIYSKRYGNTPSVEVVYVVAEDGNMLTGTVAATQLKLLFDQEVAIYTGYVVSLIAKPYDTSANEPTNPLKWIIIGCVLGSVILITIIIITACLYPCNHRCLKTDRYKVKTQSFHRLGESGGTH